MQQPPASRPPLDTTSTSTVATQPRKAAHPFDKPEADLILRTSDLVDFHVRRDILIEASPVFESILSIPQPKSDHAALSDNRPIIDLTEDHKTLDILLRICYPIVKPDWSGRSLPELESAVKAALKYEMELPLAMLTAALCAIAARRPLEAWAVACRTGLESVAQTAVLYLPKARPLEVECLGRMEGISAGNYYRLIELRLDEGTALDPLLSPPAKQSSPGSVPPYPTFEFHTDIPFPDLVCYSSDDVPFSVHKSILSAASPVLERMIKEAETPATDMSSGDANGPPVDHSDSPSPPSPTCLPVLRVSERSNVLSVLFKFCYPGFTAKLPPDPSHFISVVVAVNKYEMRVVADYIHLHWDAVAMGRPLPAYLAAASAGMRTCAVEAARHVLWKPLEGVYVTEMEDAPALAYHRLRMYYTSCRTIAKRSLTSLLPKAGLWSASEFEALATGIAAGPITKAYNNSDCDPQAVPARSRRGRPQRVWSTASTENPARSSESHDPKSILRPQDGLNFSWRQPHPYSRPRRPQDSGANPAVLSRQRSARWRGHCVAYHSKLERSNSSFDAYALPGHCTTYP